MYNGIQKIEDVIDYIEAHITEELDCDILASKMQLSVYEFRRIFSFIVGCPISEYIRKRRLSLAATEIMTNDNVNLQEISEKYGYVWENPMIKLHTTCYKAPYSYPVYPKKTYEPFGDRQYVTDKLPLTLVPFGCTTLRITYFPRADLKK